MKKVSIIIPVYNRVQILQKVLTTLELQSVPKEYFEVLVVDDGSTEDIPSALKLYPELDIRYFHQEDKGYRAAKARNIGIRNARGEILIFSDNDILFNKTVVEKHIELHKSYGNHLVLLGYMYGTSFELESTKMKEILNNFPIEQAFIEIQKHASMCDGRERYLKRSGDNVNMWQIPWLALWGGHFSVSAEFIEKHQILFDENFSSWGGEDNEFGIQLHHANAYFLFSKELQVIHYPAERDPNSDLKSKDAQNNYKKMKQYIAKKHPTKDVLLWLENGSAANEKND